MIFSCAPRSTSTKTCFRPQKELGEYYGKTAGQMLSELARKGLKPTGPERKVRNGVPLLPRQPPGTPIMTMKRVNELRDDE